MTLDLKRARPAPLAGLAIVLTLLMPTDALAQSARTFYGADGKVLGRSITNSDGVTTYYDAAGRITGRTSGDTHTIYGADGRVVGSITTTKPVPK
jgi:YD repeat-containing protein